MIELVINLSFVKSIEQLHEILRGSLGFADYYGNNLDALFDSVCEIKSPTKLVLKNFTEFQNQFFEFSQSLVLTLQDCADENENFKFEVRN